MVSSRKRLFFVLIVLLMLAIIMFLLVSCKKDNIKFKKGQYNITFLVKENGNGDWKEFATSKSNSDGVVAFPKDPSIPGYTFRAWYKDEACNDLFDGTGVSKDMKIYAFLSDKLVTVNIKGVDGKLYEIKNQPVKTLKELEKVESDKATSANLTFDGFYSNQGYTTLFDINSESNKIYARYAAKVQFYNGYENLYEKLINPGEKIIAPKTEDIKKDYMDNEGIYFVESSDRITNFNFNEPIDKNTIIRVNWQSPFLDISIIEGTQSAVVKGLNKTNANLALIDSFQVISVPSKVTVDGVEYKVIGSKANPYASKALKKIIIQEGVEYVSSLSSNGINYNFLESVELPSTLKYLEDSFNGMSQVTKDLVLPNGLVAIYNSFWKSTTSGLLKGLMDEIYDFEIIIPSSVVNMVSVPNNLVFEDGSTFFNDEYFVMNNDPKYGKTIVGINQNAVLNGNLTIPEGVEALQVGVFYNIKCEYISLPSSFSKIAYNLEKSEHPSCCAIDRMSIESAANTPDSNPEESGVKLLGYSLVSDLNNYKYITFLSNNYPENMNKYAFTDLVSDGNKSVRTPFDQLDKKNILFIGEKADGEMVDVTVNTVNRMNDTVKEVVIKDFKSGEKLSQDELLNKVGITEDKLGYKFRIGSVKQFGKLYDFSSVIKHNLYIDIEYYFAATGFTTEEDNEGNLVVTGFDQKTAQNLETNSDPEFSTYLIAIPASMNGKKIVSIKDEAFINEKKLGKVYIGSNVKKIGKKAFMNCKNLEFVTISDGDLEVIDSEAFKYAGAVQDPETKLWEVNSQLTKVDAYNKLPSLYILFPIANLKDIGPEAFNTPAIRDFATPESEKTRTVFYNLFVKGMDKLVEGEFYRFSTQALVKYIGQDSNGIMINGSKKEKLMIEFYATVGSSKDGESVVFGSHGDFMCNKIISATIKKGSIYLYYYGRSGLVFALIDKVESGAFVYLDPKYLAISEHGKENGLKVMWPGANKDCWLKKEIFIEQGKSSYKEGNIFEDGWFMGRDNTLNTFVDFVGESRANVPGM